jgi:hypothetical protein
MSGTAPPGVSWDKRRARELSPSLKAGYGFLAGGAPVVLTSTRRAPSALLVPVVDRVRDRPPMTEDYAQIATIHPRAAPAPVIVLNFRNFDQLPGPWIDRSAEVSTAGNKH